MRITIFGIDGQLGGALRRALADHEVCPAPHARADVTDARAVARAVHDDAPHWVINAAAMTHVDRCETEPEAALRVNALGALHVARAAREAGARSLTVSTDYVFDGSATRPIPESDPPRPLNVYGASRLAGEHLAALADPAAVIVRTSGLFGHDPCRGKGGANFVETMLRLAAERDALEVVDDEVLSPTYAEDLAAQIRVLLEADPPPGVYHAVSHGACSWNAFARQIVLRAGLRTPVHAVSSAHWGAPARRPAYSALRNAALESLGIDRMPSWEDALARYLAARAGAPDAAGP